MFSVGFGENFHSLYSFMGVQAFSNLASIPSHPFPDLTNYGLFKTNNKQQ